MTETVMSALLLADGTVRPVCNGCTTILEEQGMVVRVGERPINERQPGFVYAFFQIAGSFTLAECQAAVAARHYDPRGRAWGEL